MKLRTVLKSLYVSLKQVPAPNGVSSREIVQRAIEFKDPPRIPYCFFFYPTAGDIIDLGFIAAGLETKPYRKKGEIYKDKWGVRWKTTGYYWDTAIEPFPLSDLSNLKYYKFPKVVRKGMFPLFNLFTKLGKMKKKYVIGPNVLNMYERMRSLMGFEELLVACYKQPRQLEVLLDHLTQMTIDIIKGYSQIDVDAFMTWEDWGLQSRLQMRIETFREFFKPRYKQIIDFVHENNMHFFWHCCGDIRDLLPEMIDLGVDVIQLDQPRLMGHENLINIVGGKMCMWNTVDIQYITQPGILEKDIQNEIEHMIRIYNVKKYHGGFIVRNYPEPWDIKLSSEIQKLINQTFLKHINSSNF